jgi:hypothetical protein
MIAAFYQSLAARIAEVDKLRRVTLQNGQLLDPPNHYELPTPAALVEFTSVSWTDGSRGVQQGEATVSVTVASTHLGDFDHGAHGQTLALDSLRILDEVHAKLQGWSGTLWSPLSRVATEVDHSHGPVIAHTLVYRCQVVDATADTQRPLIEARPVIVTEMDVDRMPPADASVD